MNLRIWGTTLVAVAMLTAGGCGAEADDPPPDSEPAASAATAEAPVPPPSFDALVEAWPSYPKADNRRCVEYVPGSPEAEDYLAAVETELGPEAAAAAKPELPVCQKEGRDGVERVGHLTVTRGEFTDIPKKGGHIIVIQVTEHDDAAAAETSAAKQTEVYDDRVGAFDISAEDHDEGGFTPGWQGTGQRDETTYEAWSTVQTQWDTGGFDPDGKQFVDTMSEAQVVASNETMVVSVMVSGAPPGSAGRLAQRTFETWVTAAAD